MSLGSSQLLQNGNQHIGQGLVSDTAAMVAAAAAGARALGADPGSVNFADMFKSVDGADKSTAWMLSQTLVQMQQQVWSESLKG